MLRRVRFMTLLCAEWSVLAGSTMPLHKKFIQDLRVSHYRRATLD